MNSEINLSSFQKTPHTVAIRGWYSDDAKFLRTSNPDVDHPLGLVIRSVLPIGQELLRPSRFSKVWWNHNADGVVLLALHFMDCGTPDIALIPCHEKLMPIRIRAVWEVLSLRHAGTINES